MGELEKRIKVELIDRVFTECENSLKEDIKGIIKEAKEDFPLYYHPLDILKKDLEEQKGLSLSNSGAIKIIDWFVKWFKKSDK